jgi:hypothetical protein
MLLEGDRLTAASVIRDVRDTQDSIQSRGSDTLVIDCCRWKVRALTPPLKLGLVHHRSKQVEVYRTPTMRR